MRKIKFFLFFIIIALSGFTVYLLSQKFINQATSQPLSTNQKNINYPDKIYNKLISKQVKSEKEIASMFCLSLLENNNINTYKTNIKFIYSPYNSIRFYIFCKYNLKDNFSDYQSKFPQIIQNIGDNFLSNNYYFNASGYILANKIFQPIINDYFNLKIAHIMGFSFEKENNTENLIKNFSNKYFGECENEKFFIGKKNIKTNYQNLEEAICSHPETYNYLKNIFSDIKLNLHKLEILKISILKDFSIEEDTCKNINYKNIDKSTLQNIWLCSWIQNTDANKNDMKFFQNTILNEFLRYSLFVNYYKYIKLSNIDIQPITIGNGFDKKIKQNQINLNEIDIINNQTLQAIQKSFKILYNLNSTFPIHIGNRIYFEDLKKYRKSLLKIYTPIHQLYYKLQNVQDLRR